MFTATLYKAKLLTHNIKYRAQGGIDWDQIVTTSNVNNSNFSNFNIFADNAVELNCSGFTLPPIVAPIPSYDNAIAATHIVIQYLGYKIVGYITDVEYINDNNTRIYYSIDSYSSARESGLIDDIGGICERASLVCDNIFANMQPEPFSPSNVAQANSKATEIFNGAVKDIEGVTPGSGGVGTSGTKFILTVSRVIAKYVNAAAFANSPLIPGGLTQVQDLYMEGSDTTIHAGGIFRGIPYVFNSLDAVTSWILDITTGCGFIAKFDPKGYDKEDMVYRRWKAVNKHGYVTGNINWNNDPIESTLVIEQSDIYSLYCVPENFVKAATEFITGEFNLGGNLGSDSMFKVLETMHKFGPEGKDAGKFLAFPYCYYRLVTANGDSVDIIPQTMFIGADTFNPEFGVYFEVRFIGGDTPRLMGRVSMSGSGNYDPYAATAVAEWFTIRNYPAITMSINNAYNTQFQRDLTNSRQMSAASTNTISNAETSVFSAASRGFIDHVDGKQKPYNENASTGARIMYELGQGAGFISRGIKNRLGIDTTNAISDQSEIDRMNDTRTRSAGNVFTSNGGTRMGNDFLSQYALPAIAIYNCGATDAELFSYCRYIEMYGTALNCYLNPLTNESDMFGILGGQGEILPLAKGKTYYKFSSVIIEGMIPIQWKERINAMFSSGVYLI